MRVLVACEFTGIVRDAFLARGHDAWSCDLERTERPGPHFVCDVRKVLDWDWDLMIAHPPCTYLSRVGAHHLNTQPGRVKKMWKAVEFFLLLWKANVKRICVENPVMILRARDKIGKYDQIVQPFYFGDTERKATCLWLKGLPELVHRREDWVEPKIYWVGKRANGKERKFYFEGSKVGSKARSRFFPGIAKAMAEQWG